MGFYSPPFVLFEPIISGFPFVASIIILLVSAFGQIVSQYLHLLFDIMKN